MDDPQIDLEKEDWFETVCGLMNRILAQETDDLVELQLTDEELEHLMAALAYYREAVDPSSGDVLIATEYRCPRCGSNNVFRAQTNDVATEAEHTAIGVEVFRVDGIAQCSECQLQVDLVQFEPAELENFDENAWDEIYDEAYRGREVIERYQPE